MKSISLSLKIGIFIGKGASYSWIWFVKTFDLLDFNEIYFIDESDVLNDVLTNFDCFILPGGDPFQVAEGLGEIGLTKIRSFIEGGGTYIGVCAGAYLSIMFCNNPMPWLNLVDMPINNYSLNPPEAIRMKYKYLVPYRDGFVYHPVRGPLEVSCNGRSFKAPLFGGPPMLAPKENQLVKYKGFDDKTLYLTNEEEAKRTMLGYAAGVKVSVGKGNLFLFGPHFEHPNYPEANKFLFSLLCTLTPYARGPPRHEVSILAGNEFKRWIKSIKRELSSARVVANGMTNLRWKIGEKIWEDEKIIYFLNEIWKTVKILEKYDALPVERPQELESDTRKIHSLLAEIHVLSKEGKSTNTQASYLIDYTKKLSKGLFESYFNVKRNEWWTNGRKDS
ncbi:MAG: BPL-N domain-containing protein [Candidatus Methanofastidiosia archaeon]